MNLQPDFIFIFKVANIIRTYFPYKNIFNWQVFILLNDETKDFTFESITIEHNYSIFSLCVFERILIERIIFIKEVFHKIFIIIIL